MADIAPASRGQSTAVIHNSSSMNCHNEVETNTSDTTFEQSSESQMKDIFIYSYIIVDFNDRIKETTLMRPSV